ncbi:MAG TPA: PP2C family protein-serine/threonine phosphatase, partial [Thermoanaerobaculia bacterium]|nr:PP2C family protein-serine/threonine phosphatase [Thermoanaerobaculia bacterium]
AAWRWNVLAYGTLIGFLINCFCQLFHFAYQRWAVRAGAEPSRVVLSGLYFLGGVLGWLVATAIAIEAGLVPARFMRGLAPHFVPIAGALAIVIGLLFYTWGRMEDRLRRSVERLKEHEFAEKELELAREIQQRLLPPQEVEGESYRVAARNVAARFVAGDFYDVFQLAGGAVGVVVADVAGKGMGASLIMASVKAVLPFIAADRTVEETLVELNRKLVSELGPREFVALAYLRYEPDGRFTLGNAGLPDPYVLQDGASPRPLSVSGSRFPLGARRDVEYGSLEGNLQRGDRLLLFTDGLPEAPTAAGDPIGYPALEELLAGDSVSPSAYLEGVFDRLRAATGPVLADDWTAVAVERI